MCVRACLVVDGTTDIILKELFVQETTMTPANEMNSPDDGASQ